MANAALAHGTKYFAKINVFFPARKHKAELDIACFVTKTCERTHPDVSKQNSDCLITICGDPMTSSTDTKHVMLKSTAYIMVIFAFAAGLLFGSLYGSHSVAVNATKAPVAGQQPADQQSNAEQQAELAAHIEQVRGEIARAPEEALNWIHLGNLYFDSHQPQEAIQAYQTALRLKPGNVDVMTDMGTMYRLANDPQSAVRTFSDAIALDPTHQNARYNKGVTLIIDLEQVSQGVAEWKALLAAKPDATLSGGVKLADMLPDLLVDAGIRLEQAGKPAAALAAFEAALVEKPGYQPALVHLEHLRK